jgi:SAM-dependent methyltransferase
MISLNRIQRVKADPLSIKIHSDQANYYKYRTPYISDLFKDVCKELGVTKESVLMDLGCGRGEVANILSDYADKVYAIDGSKEMIDLAIRKDNIEYQVVDLNYSNPVVENKVNHIFFGRSIHWFPSESLDRFSSNLLVEDGSIVVCSTQWSPVGDWGEIYFEKKRKFISQNQKLISPSQHRKHDFTGRSNLNDAGFFPVKTIMLDRVFKVNIDFMIGHTFATAYRENLKKIKSLSIKFEDEMKNSLKIFEENLDMSIKVTTWAIIYDK